MTKFVIDQTKREALDAETATKLLQPVQHGITSVKLSGKSFGDASAPVAADALRRAADTLTYLDISDIIASRPEEEAKRSLQSFAAGLQPCKHLTYIDLSENALGAKGIRAVGDILSGQTRLQQLYLCNNGLAADAGNLITQALVGTNGETGDAVPTSLQTLHFHNNLLETAGAIALAPVVENSPRLRDFRFSSLRLGREGAVHISKALAPRVSSTLLRLNLSDNSFAGVAAAALAESLRDAPFLETLIINDALLGDDGLTALCERLVEGAPKLEVLDVSANEITAEGAKGLARLLAVGRLSDVRAEDNEFGNKGAARLAQGVAKSATLKKLCVNCCDISSKGALALAGALANVKCLESLEIDGNTISADAIVSIQRLLEDKLGSLDDNDEDDEEEDDDDDDEDDDEDQDEADTDKAAQGGDTAENVDINQEEEKLDDLVAQVEKLNI